VAAQAGIGASAPENSGKFSLIQVYSGKFNHNEYFAENHARVKSLLRMAAVLFADGCG
jgi:hypothetical protein